MRALLWAKRLRAFTDKWIAPSPFIDGGFHCVDVGLCCNALHVTPGLIATVPLKRVTAAKFYSAIKAPAEHQMTVKIGRFVNLFSVGRFVHALNVARMLACQFREST